MKTTRMKKRMKFGENEQKKNKMRKREREVGNEGHSTRLCALNELPELLYCCSRAPAKF